MATQYFNNQFQHLFESWRFEMLQSPKSLLRADVFKINHHWVYSEKLNGERGLLIDDGNVCKLMYSNRYENRESKHRPMVLDCEVVGKKIYVLDVFVYDGVPVREEDLEARVRLVSEYYCTQVYKPISLFRETETEGYIFQPLRSIPLRHLIYKYKIRYTIDFERISDTLLQTSDGKVFRCRGEGRGIQEYDEFLEFVKHRPDKSIPNHSIIYFQSEDLAVLCDITDHFQRLNATEVYEPLIGTVRPEPAPRTFREMEDPFEYYHDLEGDTFHEKYDPVYVHKYPGIVDYNRQILSMTISITPLKCKEHLENCYVELRGRLHNTADFSVCKCLAGDDKVRAIFDVLDEQFLTTASLEKTAWLREKLKNPNLLVEVHEERFHIYEYREGMMEKITVQEEIDEHILNSLEVFCRGNSLDFLVIPANIVNVTYDTVPIRFATVYDYMISQNITLDEHNVKYEERKKQILKEGFLFKSEPPLSNEERWDETIEGAVSYDRIKRSVNRKPRKEEVSKRGNGRRGRGTKKKR